MTEILNEHNGTMCDICTNRTLRQCERCEYVQDVIDTWWRDAGSHKGGNCHRLEYGPGKMGEKWDMTKPSIMETIHANTEHMKIERQRAAMDRWDHIGKKTPVHYPRYEQTEGNRLQQNTQTPFERGDPTGETAKHTYPTPERAHDPMEYIYTDGSKREIETAERGKE